MSTPQPGNALGAANLPEGGGFGSRVLREDEAAPVSNATTRAEIRRLEHKVARVAAKKCSVEEVSSLHKELQDWLASDVVQKDQAASLHLSAALLRAVLMNHVAHTELVANLETRWKEKYGEVEMTKNKLDSELHSLRSQYTQKSQECHALRAELYYIKGKSSNVDTAAPPPVPSAASSATIPPRVWRPPSVDPTFKSAPSPAPPPQRPYSSTSFRNRSGSTTQRPFTPFARTHTPATVQTSQVTAAADGRGAANPTEAPPTQAPSRVTRSNSNFDEQERPHDSDRQRDKDARRVQLIQRWIPGAEAMDIPRPPSGRPDRFHSQTPGAGPSTSRSIPEAGTSPSRTMLAASSGLHPPSRYKTPLSHAPQ